MKQLYSVVVCVGPPERERSYSHADGLAYSDARAVAAKLRSYWDAQIAHGTRSTHPGTVRIVRDVRGESIRRST